MPEAVKYERVQTTEADAGQNEDFQATTIHRRASDVKVEVTTTTTTTKGINGGLNRSASGIFLQTTLATLALILFYFCLSIGLTFYQRHLLQVSDLFGH